MLSRRQRRETQPPPRDLTSLNHLADMRLAQDADDHGKIPTDFEAVFELKKLRREK